MPQSESQLNASSSNDRIGQTRVKVSTVGDVQKQNRFGRGAVLGGAAPRCDPLRLIRVVRLVCPLPEGQTRQFLIIGQVKGATTDC